MCWGLASTKPSRHDSRSVQLQGVPVLDPVYYNIKLSLLYKWKWICCNCENLGTENPRKHVRGGVASHVSRISITGVFADSGPWVAMLYLDSLVTRLFNFVRPWHHGSFAHERRDPYVFSVAIDFPIHWSLGSLTIGRYGESSIEQWVFDSDWPDPKWR
jgi:hypothetical protein